MISPAALCGGVYMFEQASDEKEGDMRRSLTIDLSHELSSQVDHMSALLGISPEALLELALHLSMSEWKEIVPELKAFEGAPVQAPGLWPDAEATRRKAS